MRRTIRQLREIRILIRPPGSANQRAGGKESDMHLERFYAGHSLCRGDKCCYRKADRYYSKNMGDLHTTLLTAVSR